MKTALFKISGVPNAGDLIVLSARSPKGGSSNAKFTAKGERVSAELVNGDAVKIVKPAETPNEIALGLSQAFGTHEFAAGMFAPRASDDLLIVSVADQLDNVTFVAEVHGTGTVKVEEQ